MVFGSRVEGLGYLGHLGNWGYIGITEKNMEATIVQWGYTGVIKVETTM